jgi:hypothetical protein
LNTVHKEVTHDEGNGYVTENCDHEKKYFFYLEVKGVTRIVMLNVVMFCADTDSEVEEYLPEQTGENLAVLQLAGEPVDFDKDEDQETSLNGTEDFAVDTDNGGKFYFALQTYTQVCF